MCCEQVASNRVRQAARVKNDCEELKRERNKQRDEAIRSLLASGSNGLDARGDMVCGGGQPRRLSVRPRVRV